MTERKIRATAGRPGSVRHSTNLDPVDRGRRGPRVEKLFQYRLLLPVAEVVGSDSETIIALPF